MNFESFDANAVMESAESILGGVALKLIESGDTESVKAIMRFRKKFRAKAKELDGMLAVLKRIDGAGFHNIAREIADMEQVAGSMSGVRV
jgi:hypothetical protein